MKTLNNSSRCNKAISLINKGKTWEEVSKILDLSVPYIQKLVKLHYKRDKAYNNLLAKARENKKAKIQDFIVSEDINEVIVTETGYVMKVGVPNEALDMYIPAFCIGELEKLANRSQEAVDFLTVCWETSKVRCINIRGREMLYKQPSFPVKNRSKGIVAVAIELIKMGFKVRLLTTSYEVAQLAELQDCGITVVYEA